MNSSFGIKSLNGACKIDEYLFKCRWKMQLTTGEFQEKQENSNNSNNKFISSELAIIGGCEHVCVCECVCVVE